METNPTIINARGRITNLWKEQNRTDCLFQGVKLRDQYNVETDSRIRGSNGTYFEIGEYLGTELYINLTIYNPPFFEFSNKIYQIPQRIRIECYENIRKAIGHKAFGNLAIFDSDLENLKSSLVGEKTDVYFLSHQTMLNNNTLKVLISLPHQINGETPFTYCMMVTEKL